MAAPPVMRLRHRASLHHPQPQLAHLTHFRTLKYANYVHQMASTPRQLDPERASSLSSDSTISPCSEDTLKNARIFAKTTAEEIQLGQMEDSNVYRINASLSGGAVSPLQSRRVRFDLKDCSLDESHRWHSEDCSFADVGSDADKVVALSITKDRLASHHHVVNYNFRPFVGEGARGHPFKRHCSCLVLSECPPDFGFESLLSSTDSKGSVKKALLNVMSNAKREAAACERRKWWRFGSVLVNAQLSCGRSVRRRPLGERGQ
ncbi:hypothetical protein MTO96_035018 [Rhipicephalus appendiculatus]